MQLLQNGRCLNDPTLEDALYEIMALNPLAGLTLKVPRSKNSTISNPPAPTEKTYFSPCSPNQYQW